MDDVNVRLEDLVKRCEALLVKLDQPAISLEFQLWDHGDVSAYFKRHPRTVREQITCLPSFPKAIRLPSKDRCAQPLYRAGEVVEWANQFRDRH
ncbi:hypothetical protein KY495_11715 [Massilia sp. PAMC28688]|uniref:hypothetical protein n=1 Tax=Massilia sp. PAMC28688 TaxID=2861283 RepID=UPI001C634CF4|nr:hypothetical protein [Massilia sp. PAMC28688]QYF95757.1 hypothetical protein KY495_11715 [Massilia sp. PAMC28688]